VNWSAEPIEAALFDLDDTLYLQQHWLTGAWTAVAEAGVGLGLDREPLHRALLTVASEGSGRGRIIDRALAAVCADTVYSRPLVAAFRSYRAPRLPCFPGVSEALARLRTRIPIGLVTDGDVGIQRGKLASLGLLDAFDVVIYSDGLGREHRKPASAPFLAALYHLNILSERAVFVGDRPDTDIAGAAAVGMRAIRVQTGEYSAQPDELRPWASAFDAAQAIDLVERTTEPVSGTR